MKKAFFSVFISSQSRGLQKKVKGKREKVKEKIVVTMPVVIIRGKVEGKRKKLHGGTVKIG